MNLAEIFFKNKAKNVGESIDSVRLFNAVFGKKINKYSRVTIVAVLNSEKIV